MQSRRWYLAAGLTGLVVDQLAKWLAIASLPPFGAAKDWGAGFGLTAYINNRFAWSWGVPNGLVIIFTILLLVLGGFVYFRYGRTRLELAPIFLIASGAISNLIDRVSRHGAVDYFLVPGGGAINLADILIFIGVGLLIINTHHENS